MGRGTAITLVIHDSCLRILAVSVYLRGVRLAPQSALEKLLRLCLAVATTSRTSDCQQSKSDLQDLPGGQIYAKVPVFKLKFIASSISRDVKE
jgi:hypothetical protein